MKLVPFVLGHGPWIDGFRAAIDDALGADGGAVVKDVLDDDSADFFALVNAANARAFGGLSMPAWVQLDCATLPTAMVGFAMKARELDASLVDDLAARAGVPVGDDDLVPVAEYCALPTPEPGHVVGFSLFSLVAGLGLRVKALGLFSLQARVQTGITQADPLRPLQGALRTHCRLGPLVVEKRGVRVHSKPGTTLVYRLQVPPSSTLAALGRGALTRVPFSGTTTKKAGLDDGDTLVDVAADGFVVAA